MNTSDSVDNIVPRVSRRMLITENVAMRLFNSVNRSTPAVRPEESLLSICSANDLGHSCRICRWHRNDLPIQECPCECRGSVGYVHLKCLRRWIVHRGDDRCEICATRFQLSPEKRDYMRLFWSLFKWKYFGALFKNSVHLVSLAPISYVVLYQVLQIMDKLQMEEHNTWHVLVLVPALLLTSSIIFFHILEFSITRCLIMKNIIVHWWNFGDQDTDSPVDMEMPSEVFEFF